ncbi:unnamed protein product, partial [Citrullus colocynthis]
PPRPRLLARNRPPPMMPTAGKISSLVGFVRAACFFVCRWSVGRHRSSSFAAVRAQVAWSAISLYSSLTHLFQCVSCSTAQPRQVTVAHLC